MKININIEADDDSLFLKDFILSGKVFDGDDFYDVIVASGVLDDKGNIIGDIDPVNKEGLKVFLLNSKD